MKPWVLEKWKWVGSPIEWVQGLTFLPFIAFVVTDHLLQSIYLIIDLCWFKLYQIFKTFFSWQDNLEPNLWMSSSRLWIEDISVDREYFINIWRYFPTYFYLLLVSYQRPKQCLYFSNFNCSYFSNFDRFWQPIFCCYCCY